MSRLIDFGMLTIVCPSCALGDEVQIFNFCNIYNGTIIGPKSKIASYVEISGAVIGKNVSIGAYSFIPSGVTIEDDAFIGPGVHFTHDFPPQPKEEWDKTTVGKGAKIGSKAVILGGVSIGEGAVIGAGSVVTGDVPAGKVYAGNPAVELTKRVV